MLSVAISPLHTSTSLQLKSSYHANFTLCFTGKHTQSCTHIHIHIHILTFLAHTQTAILTTIYITPSTRVQICCRVHRQPLKFNDAQQQDRERMRGVTALMSGHIARGSETSRQRASEKASLSTSTFLTSYILKETHSQLFLLRFQFSKQKTFWTDMMDTTKMLMATYKLSSQMHCLPNPLEICPLLSEKSQISHDVVSCSTAYVFS